MRLHGTGLTQTGLVCLLLMVSSQSTAADLFAPAVNYGAGSNPGFVAVGDFKEDGVPDLAVANTNLFGTGSSSVSVLLGKGDGTFDAAVNYGVGRNPRSIAVGDFNADHHADLAVANENGPRVSILAGNGDGTFQPAVNFPAGRRPFFVAAADFNRDGALDLVVTNFVNAGRISTLMGNGDGTFQAPVPHAIAPSMRAHMVVIADVNSDARLDLIVASAGVFQKPGGISVLMGKGDGNFRAPLNFLAGDSPFAVALGDLNGDGKLDLAVANETASTLSVLLGLGAGKFGFWGSFFTGSLPFSIVLADVDSDGTLDAVTANENGNDVSVLTGRGNGAFRDAVSAAANQAPQCVASGDFNGDGAPDVAVANLISNDVSVLLNTAAGTR